MQKDFVLEGAPMMVKGALGIIDNIKEVLEEFRKKKAPIFHIVRVHRPDGSDVEVTRKDKFRKKAFAVVGTKGAEIIDDIKPKGAEYLVKKIRMSSFMNTDLDYMLRSLEIKNLVLTGIQTPNCIRATAFDAMAYNYNTYLVEDASAAQTMEIHQANILDMKNIGTNIIKASDAKNLLG
ncbi:MAG: cysteine hydrolase [Candidatus Omnitrophica bacterium]|nr:cysteine hydrolase [Candidatus Omnitrophota bacterium]